MRTLPLVNRCRWLPILALALLVLATAVQAESEKAMKLPALLQQLLPEGSVSGHFEQSKQLQGLDIELKSKGHFRFADGQLRWQVTSPIASELRISRDRIVQYDNGREVFSLSAEEQPLSVLVSDIFLALFSGDWPQLQQHFTLQLSGEADAWQMQLQPRNDTIAEFASTITLRGGEQLHSLQLQERNGDRTRIRFYHDQPG